MKQLWLSFLTLSLVACVKGPSDSSAPIEPDHFSFIAEETNPSAANDPLRAKLGQFFLVEHFAPTVDNTMIAAIQQHQPGGILFWNPQNSSSTDLREVIRRYSTTAIAAGHAPILFSADYEGGGASLSPKGNTVAGIQRFTKGFTPLAHPAWLGLSLSKHGTDLCTLHGKIMARELVSVGINYPLSVLSDFKMNLMIDRGISTDPEQIAACNEAILDAFQAETNILFVTKHFPGLGEVPADTHEGTAVCQIKTEAEMEKSIEPFSLLIAHAHERSSIPLLSVMASHALYPLLDADNMTTESEKILTGVLRTQLQFQGISLSDAMWMGKYGKMKDDDLMVAYVHSFLSGMDMLMIPGSKFATAISFYRSIYDNKPDPKMQSLVHNKLGLSWNQLRSRFLERMQESLARIEQSQKAIKHSAEVMDATDIIPENTTSALRKRYSQILEEMNPEFLKFYQLAP